MADAGFAADFRQAVDDDAHAIGYPFPSVRQCANESAKHLVGTAVIDETLAGRIHVSPAASVLHRARQPNLPGPSTAINARNRPVHRAKTVGRSSSIQAGRKGMHTDFAAPAAARLTWPRFTVCIGCTGPYSQWIAWRALLHMQHHATCPARRGDSSRNRRKVASLVCCTSDHQNWPRRHEPCRLEEDKVARPRREAMQTIDNRAGLNGVSQLLAVHPRVEAGIDARPRTGLQDEPRLRLAALTGPQSSRRLVIGMYLHREPIATVQPFDEPGKVTCGRPASSDR